MLGRGGREKGSMGEDSWAPNLVMESRDIEESGGRKWQFYYSR